MGGDRAAWCGIGLLAGILCFTGLLCPLQEPQESRYAEIPRQMLATGNFIVPVLHGQPYLDKPPLFYWLVMASYAAFGVNETAARLVPCVAAFLTIGILFAWGRRFAGVRAGFIGAAILCLAPRFIQLDRMLTMDSVLCLWVVAAWGCGHQALANGPLRRGWWRAAAFACGLALLTKGPVALVLAPVPLLALRWLDPAAARPGVRAWTAFLVVSCGVAAPWFVAVALRDSHFPAYFFWFHHVQRFMDPFDHAGPWWYYVPEILVGMLPWTLLLPGLVATLTRRGPGTEMMRLCAMAALWGVVFFSLAGCKRPFYILPAMPPLALALGCYLDQVFAGRELPRAAWLAGGALTLVMTGAVTLFLPGYARQFSLRAEVGRQAEAAGDSRVPVICYPRRWDSVSFYLRRDDVQVFRADEWEALRAELASRPGAIVFARTGRPGESAAAEFRAQLPEGLAWESLGKAGRLTVGRVIVRPRTVAANPGPAP